MARVRFAPNKTEATRGVKLPNGDRSPILKGRAAMLPRRNVGERVRRMGMLPLVSCHA